MTVQKTDIHKKKSVSDGETVDKQTRGNLQFGVDKAGKARPISSSLTGLDTRDFTLLNVAKEILIELRIIKSHLADITGEDFDGNN